MQYNSHIYLKGSTNDIKLNDMKLLKCAHFLSEWLRFTARRL